MALLGRNGRLQFQRPLPEPQVLPASARISGGVLFTLIADNFWTTDNVLLIGLGAANAVVVITGYMHRDVLDRISIHSTQVGSLNDTSATRLSLAAITTGPMVLAHLGSAGQTTALSTFVSTGPTVTAEAPLRAFPSTLTAYNAAATPSTVPWAYSGVLRSWTLNLNSDAIDTSLIGDKYGSATKAIVTGSGSLDFLVDLYASATVEDSDALLRYALLVENGCDINARFYLKPATTENEGAYAIVQRMNLAESLYYDTRILFTSSSVTMNAEEMVVGSADFVTTGPIRLRSDIA